jgi:hypothetical protein
MLVNIFAVQTGALKKMHSIVGTKMTNREVDGKFPGSAAQYRGSPCR